VDALIAEECATAPPPVGIKQIHRSGTQHQSFKQLSWDSHLR
jgi:hypothetical protein